MAIDYNILSRLVIEIYPRVGDIASASVIEIPEGITCVIQKRQDLQDAEIHLGKYRFPATPGKPFVETISLNAVLFDTGYRVFFSGYKCTPCPSIASITE